LVAAIQEENIMPKSPQTDSKIQALHEQGSLNPHPKKVRDPRFREEEFFDPRDLVQVKYEMIRRVRKEGVSVSDATSAFGFSRPVFYQASKCLDQKGITGLLPQQRGPKHAHKLSGEVMRSIDQAISEDPSLRAPGLANLVKKSFGISVHPRSIERAMVRWQKKTWK
jgi:transposase